MVVCTVAAHNYSAKAAYLATTLRFQEPTARLVWCVPEVGLPSPEACGIFDAVLTCEMLNGPDFRRFAFLHTVIELSTAVKAQLLLYCLDLFRDEDQFVYLDPDIEVLSPLSEVADLLQTTEVLLTPNHLHEPVDPSQLIPCLLYGAYNLGFIAVRRGSTCNDFLRWWAHKLGRFCYVDRGLGLFVDQKWIDLAASFFPVGILRHPGYNIGYWNIRARPITLMCDRATVLGQPVRFVHFSGIDTGKDQRYFRRNAPSDGAIHAVRRNYLRRLENCGWSRSRSQPWSYDSYLSGEPIAQEVRVACRLQPEALRDCDDPFAMSNEYFFERTTKP